MSRRNVDKQETLRLFQVALQENLPATHRVAVHELPLAWLTLEASSSNVRQGCAGADAERIRLHLGRY